MNGTFAITMVSPYKLPQLVHMHRSKGDNMQEIMGSIGEVWAKWGLGQVPHTQVFVSSTI